MKRYKFNQNVDEVKELLFFQIKNVSSFLISFLAYHFRIKSSIVMHKMQKDIARDKQKGSDNFFGLNFSNQPVLHLKDFVRVDVLENFVKTDFVSIGDKNLPERGLLETINQEFDTAGV